MRTLVFFLVLLAIPARAEIVFVTQEVRDATLRIYPSLYRMSACHVFVTQSRTEALHRSGVWFFTRNRAEATIRVYYERSSTTGAKPVFFTQSRGDVKCPD